MLCIKPQYALLVPVVVFAGRYWRVMLAGIIGLFVFWHFPSCWEGLAFGRDISGLAGRRCGGLLAQPFGAYEVMGTSVFWMARSFGASLGAAYAVQGLVSVLAALAVWRLWQAPVADPARRVAMTVFLTLLASPYGFTDDLAIYSVLLPTLAVRGAPWRNALLAWLWVAPALVPKFVAVFGFLPTPLLLVSALVLAGPALPRSGFAQQKQSLLTEQIGQSG